MSVLPFNMLTLITEDIHFGWMDAQKLIPNPDFWQLLIIANSGTRLKEPAPKAMANKMAELLDFPPAARATKVRDLVKIFFDYCSTESLGMAKQETVAMFIEHHNKVVKARGRSARDEFSQIGNSLSVLLKAAAGDTKDMLSRMESEIVVKLATIPGAKLQYRLFLSVPYELSGRIQLALAAKTSASRIMPQNALDFLSSYGSEDLDLSEVHTIISRARAAKTWDNYTIVGDKRSRNKGTLVKVGAGQRTIFAIEIV